MTPLSEADREIYEKVTDLIGPCSCRVSYTIRWVGHESDRRDPRCDYHRFGEHFANLFRENRRLRRSLERINLHRQKKD